MNEKSIGLLRDIVVNANQAIENLTPPYVDLEGFDCNISIITQQLQELKKHKLEEDT